MGTRELVHLDLRLRSTNVGSMADALAVARATPKSTPRNGEIMFHKRMTAAVAGAFMLALLAPACSSDSNKTNTTINGSPTVSTPTGGSTVGTTGGLSTLPSETTGS